MDRLNRFRLRVRTELELLGWECVSLRGPNCPTRTDMDVRAELRRRGRLAGRARASTCSGRRSSCPRASTSRAPRRSSRCASSAAGRPWAPSSRSGEPSVIPAEAGAVVRRRLGQLHQGLLHRPGAGRAGRLPRQQHAAQAAGSRAGRRTCCRRWAPRSSWTARCGARLTSVGRVARPACAGRARVRAPLGRARSRCGADGGLGRRSDRGGTRPGCAQLPLIDCRSSADRPGVGPYDGGVTHYEVLGRRAATRTDRGDPPRLPGARPPAPPRLPRRRRRRARWTPPRRACARSTWRGRCSATSRAAPPTTGRSACAATPGPVSTRADHQAAVHRVPAVLRRATRTMTTPGGTSPTRATPTTVPPKALLMAPPALAGARGWCCSRSACRPAVAPLTVFGVMSPGPRVAAVHRHARSWRCSAARAPRSAPASALGSAAHGHLPRRDPRPCTAPAQRRTCARTDALVEAARELPPDPRVPLVRCADGDRPPVIAEVKRRSPSKGPLAPDLDPAALAGAVPGPAVPRACRC